MGIIKGGRCGTSPFRDPVEAPSVGLPVGPHLQHKAACQLCAAFSDPGGDGDLEVLGLVGPVVVAVREAGAELGDEACFRVDLEVVAQLGDRHC